MDSTDDLIFRFRDSGAGEKFEITRQLGDVENVGVLEFLISIASDEAEYDYVRIEALKALRDRNISHQDEREAAGQAIRRVLGDSLDRGVRIYAAQALGSFPDVSGTVEMLGRTILHPDDDEDVRLNALDAIGAIGPDASTKEILRRCLGDETLVTLASELLEKWEKS